MFKILKSLSKSLTGSKTPAPSKAEPAKPAAAPVDTVPKAAAAPPPPKAAAPVPPKTAEEMCEVTAKMTKSEIHARLKLLYRRYNRAASSLNVQTRAEADAMLNAIVDVREKHFGPI